MKEIKTKTELDEVLNNTDDNNLIIIKYSATWCAPCQMLGNVIHEIEGDYNNVTFIEVDCDAADNDLMEMNHITSIPRMIFYKGGFIVDDTLGNMTKDNLVRKIEINSKK